MVRLMKLNVPMRAIIALMMFSATFMGYTVRVNMSINIIAMIRTTGHSTHRNLSECLALINTTETTPKSNGVIVGPISVEDNDSFEWNTRLQGYILGSYFWGFTLMGIPGGLLAERFGPTRSVLYSALSAGFLTALGPLAAQLHYTVLMLTRFLIGLCGAFIYPSMHALISKWAPPTEKGRFTTTLLGGTFGTVVTWPLLGTIIEFWSWQCSFYLNGALVMFWALLWWLFVTDTPQTHPWIKDAERNHIVKALETTSSGDSALKKRMPPLRAIFTSIPFWALAILHFGNNWGLFFLMTATPTFLSSVLGFALGHVGILAALPHLARLLFGFMFGIVGDWLPSRKFLTVGAIRKGFVLFSHILPGALLLILTAVGCNIEWTIALLTLSLGFNGASTLTNLQNPQDLAPNFAGMIYGIINCLGSTTGFITPAIVGYLTANQNGLHEWHQIFTIGATVYIVSALVFCSFGSAELQKWNSIEAITSASKDSSTDGNSSKTDIENPTLRRSNHEISSEI